MDQKAAQEKFLDLLEGRLSKTEEAELRALLESSAELAKSFQQYQTLMRMEDAILRQDAVLGPDFSVKVMEEIEGYSPGNKGRVEAFMKIQKKFMYGAALAATACVAIVLAKRTEPETFTGNQIPQYNEKLVDNAVGDLFQSEPVAKAIEELDVTEAKDEESAQPTTAYSAPPVPTAFDRMHNKVASSGPAGAAPLEFRDMIGRSAGQAMETADSYVGYYEPGKPMPHIPSGYGETYAAYEENPRIAVATEPVSTFSIDVDTGSYTNVRRFLSMGQLPPNDAVRIEEFINYFDYNYPQQTEQPFGVYYEVAPSPLDSGRYLLKVGLRARDVVQDSAKGWNLVFLVDVSGSMSDSNKLGLIKQSLKMLTDKMREQDRIAIVTYAGNAGTVLESTSGKEKGKIIAAIDALGAGGGTNGAGGIDMAYKVAEQNRKSDGVNRVILATDGDFNVGMYDFEGLKNLIEQKRKTGITLTTIGVGTGNYNEQNLEQMANKGNGQYFYFDTFKEARRVLQSRLTATMEMVAKDVKLQIEFNPSEVAEYRLIGYDNRKLANEDFANDKVDAGEIGSGHTVTALYELVLANSELAKKLSSELRYQDKKAEAPVVENKHQGELGFLKIRFKEPNSDTSKLVEYPIKASAILSDATKASDDFKFAAAVTYFGATLRDSKYKGDYSLADIAKLARSGKGADADGSRQELIELIENAASIKR